MTAPTYPDLGGRVALVTGGASGIGAHIVRRLRDNGARVGLIDLDGDAAAAVSEATGAERALADLRDVDATRGAVDALRDRLGPVDLLVNNAARDDRHDWRETTPEYWDERMHTNLRHMFFVLQAVAPDMIAKGRGSVVNMGSNSWWEAGAGFPAYATAKSAVHGLTRTMARELGGHRIRVNCVVPGWIMTERQRALWVTEAALAKHLDRQCLPDPVEPAQVAEMVLFLLSDASGACTASNFFVDGGSV